MVSLTDIGEGYNALHCLTNLTICCRGADGGSAGEWFLPGKTSPVVDVNAPNAGTESFIRSRGPSAVLLNRNTSTMGSTGLYTCQVPDGSGTNRTLYIGVGAGTDYTSCDMHVVLAFQYSHLQVFLPSLTLTMIVLQGP